MEVTTLKITYRIGAGLESVHHQPQTELIEFMDSINNSRKHDMMASFYTPTGELVISVPARSIVSMAPMDDLGEGVQ